MIKLYGFDSCGPCKHVKNLLEKFGVEYEYIDVLKERHGWNLDAVPMLVLEDGTEIIGLGKQMTNYIRKLGREHKRQ